MATSEEVTTDENVIDIYFLAAPEDEKHCKDIQKYLNPVIRNSKHPIKIFSDFDIPAGEDVATYKQKLYDSEIVLAFISADFINDDATYLRTQKVIERYNKNEIIMLPILVRNCMWKSTPFVNLPLLPKNFQPLNNREHWKNEEDALTEVATDIYGAIKTYTEESTTADSKIVEEPLADVEVTNPSSDETSAAEIQQEITQKVAPTDTSNIVKAPPTAKKINNAPIDASWRKGYYKDTFWKRGIAFILDIVITAIPSIFFAFFAYFFFSGFVQGILDPEGEFADVSDFEMGFVSIASFFFYFIFCAFFESSKYKGTFGKQILKLEITDRNGARIGFFKAFIRNILRVFTASSYFLIIPLIIQINTYRKNHKFFHDQISYTVVGEKTRRKR